MSITLAESGLTSEQYNNFKSMAYTSPAYQVIAHKLNPTWSDVVDEYDGNTFQNGSYIYYANVTGVGQFQIWRFDAQHYTHANLSNPAFLGDGQTDYTVDRPEVVDNGAGGYEVYYLYDGNIVNLAGTVLVTGAANGATVEWLAHDYDNFKLRQDPVYSLNSTYDDVYPDIIGSTQYQKNAPANAGDRDLDTAWTATTTSGILTLGFTFSKVVDQYAITASGNSGPRAWTFQGADSLGGPWITIDTQSLALAVWQPEERRVYTPSNRANFRYYRLNVTTIQGGTRLSIREFEVLTYGQSADAYNYHYTLYNVSSPKVNHVYYYEWDNTDKVYTLKHRDPTPSTWSLLATPHLPYWIDTLELDSSTHLILVATKIPGADTVRTDGTKTIDYHIYDSVIYLLWYDLGSHKVTREIIVDKTVPPVVFTRCYISTVNDRYIITAGVVGTNLGGDPLYQSRFYASKDAYHWNKGEIVLPVMPANVYQYSSIIHVGSYITPVCPFFGDSLEQYDLTERVADYQIGATPSTQVSLTIDNSGDFIPTIVDWINNDNQIMLEQRLGFQTGDGPVTVHLPDILVETISFQQSGGEKTVHLVGRDLSSLIDHHTQAEDAMIWNSQKLGYDDYTDSTETNYGGMSHTLQQQGIWKTSSGALVNTRSNSSSAYAIVFSTFDKDTWNGTFEMSFQLNDITNALCGFAFRAQDKDNMYALVYVASIDLFQFFEVRQGYWKLLSQSGITVSSLLSGFKTNAATNPRYMRLTLWHQWFTLDLSTNGIDWTNYYNNSRIPVSPYAVHTYRNEEGDLTGQDALVLRDHFKRDRRWIPFEKGYVGIVSY